MWQDEIIKEIHKLRQEHDKLFNYDLDAMFADWQKKGYVVNMLLTILKAFFARDSSCLCYTCTTSFT